MQAFNDAFRAEGRKDTGGPERTAVEKRLGPVFTHLLKEDGHYDVFLISAEGNVVFTAVKESDLGQNLVSGFLKDSGLGRAFRDSETRKTAFADLAPYAPSNNHPAGFFSRRPLSMAPASGWAPWRSRSRSTMINQIMQERTGLGRTGETYLVGPDKLMRSDSFRDPTDHLVKASFANPQSGKVDTDTTRNAFAGRS